MDSRFEWTTSPLSQINYTITSPQGYWGCLHPSTATEVLWKGQRYPTLTHALYASIFPSTAPHYHGEIARLPIENVHIYAEHYYMDFLVALLRAYLQDGMQLVLRDTGLWEALQASNERPIFCNDTTGLNILTLETTFQAQDILSGLLIALRGRGVDPTQEPIDFTGILDRPSPLVVVAIPTTTLREYMYVRLYYDLAYYKDQVTRMSTSAWLPGLAEHDMERLAETIYFVEKDYRTVMVTQMFGHVMNERFQMPTDNPVFLRMRNRRQTAITPRSIAFPGCLQSIVAETMAQYANTHQWNAHPIDLPTKTLVHNLLLRDVFFDWFERVQIPVLKDLFRTARIVHQYYLSRSKKRKTLWSHFETQFLPRFMNLFARCPWKPNRIDAPDIMRQDEILGPNLEVAWGFASMNLIRLYDTDFHAIDDLIQARDQMLQQLTFPLPIFLYSFSNALSIVVPRYTKTYAEEDYWMALRVLGCPSEWVDAIHSESQMLRDAFQAQDWTALDPVFEQDITLAPTDALLTLDTLQQFPIDILAYSVALARIQHKLPLRVKSRIYILRPYDPESSVVNESNAPLVEDELLARKRYAPALPRSLFQTDEERQESVPTEEPTTLFSLLRSTFSLL